MDKKITDWLKVGALVGFLTIPILWALARLPMLQITFSTISLNLREKVTQNLLGPEFAEFIKGYLGISITMPALIAGVISGALLVVAAKWILDKTPFKPKKFAKLTTVVFIALLIEMVVLNFLVVPTFGAILGFAIAAIAVSGAVYGIYKQVLKKPLPE